MTRQEYLDIYEAIGVAMHVHKTLGRGMEEPVYQEAYALEMKLQGKFVEREKELTTEYYSNLPKLLFSFVK